MPFLTKLKKVVGNLTYHPQQERDEFYIPKYPDHDDRKPKPKKDEKISSKIEDNLLYMQQAFCADKNNDIVIRQFSLSNGRKAFIVYIDGMVKSTTINEFILKPLFLEPISEEEDLQKKIQSIVQINALKPTELYAEAIDAVLIGDTTICIDGLSQMFTGETKGFDKRSVGKPQNESTIKGAQEAFNESIRTNTTLIRRIVKSKDLVTEFMKIGQINNNFCGVMYINGLANPAIVAEVKRRIESIKSDFLFGSGMLEQFIEDGPFRIFPNILSTERPDTVAMHLCQGRVAVVVDGTPFALVMPIGIANMIKSVEDSSLRWQYSTVLRFTRIVSIIMSVLLPGFFVAIVNYHRGMIPTELLVAIAKSRESVPFPTVLEVLIMEFSFELIREAGVRVPGVIGNTIGIVGGLILGQAAVTANLVSPVMIIIIAFTGIANFAIPDFSFAFGVRILRFLFIVLAGMLGFVGLGLGMVVVIAFITTQKSFGVGVLAPIAPKTVTKANLVLSPPEWKKELRPDELNPSKKDNQPKISRRWILKKTPKSNDKGAQK